MHRRPFEGRHLVLSSDAIDILCLIHPNFSRKNMIVCKEKSTAYSDMKYASVTIGGESIAGGAVAWPNSNNDSVC